MTPRQIEVWVRDFLPSGNSLVNETNQFQNHRNRAKQNGKPLNKRIPNSCNENRLFDQSLFQDTWTSDAESTDEELFGEVEGEEVGTSTKWKILPVKSLWLIGITNFFYLIELPSRLLCSSSRISDKIHPAARCRSLSNSRWPLRFSRSLLGSRSNKLQAQHRYAFRR